MFKWAGCVVVILPLSAAAAQTSEREPVVVSRGFAEVSAPASRAIITMTVETRGDTVSRVSAHNAAIMTRLQAALVAAGVPAAQITTRGYNVMTNERVMFAPREVRMLDSSRYVARNSVTVEVRDLAQVGRILEVGANAGATGLAAGQFEAEATEELRQRALAAAVEDSRRSAETMARAAGGSLGQLREVNNIAGSSFGRGVAMMADMEISSSRPPVSARPVVVRAEVITRWQLILPAR